MQTEIKEKDNTSSMPQETLVEKKTEDKKTDETSQTTTSHTTVKGWKNVTDNKGVELMLNGMGTVFIGLILIALVIRLFNVIFAREKKPVEASSTTSVKDESSQKVTVAEDVDDDVVVAIATTVELYRRLHIEDLHTKITFRHGKDIGTAWKMGNKFGYRE